ncbi:competence protein CoiA family protein [Peribacillus asahii]|uniref:competence protein CoiA family protein n=1 Tax=Peribacillus asahii TaxID=228899 RepID=UPI00207A6DE7|nr:competence protein CoiA family protein [Peribacillus asahii]USK69189.1 hypothetical protein LIS76_16695 [Peribacillus asahii]
MHKLPYGLKNGKIVYISDVESGLKCNCVCPSCNGQLIAKKGSRKNHHFAHYNSEECSHGLETALHFVAKEIINKRKKFRIPNVILPFGIRKKERVFRNSAYINISNVRLEYKLEGVVPDILANINGTLLIIEIKVTHGIDSVKLEKLKSLNISTIEINLSRHSRSFNPVEFEKIIIDEVENKKWIFNKRVEEETVRIINSCQKVRVYGRRKFIVGCPLFTSEINFTDCQKCSYIIDYNKEEKIVLCGKESGITNT